MSRESEACEEAVRRIRAGECVECGVNLGPEPVRGWCDACYYAPDPERRPTLAEREAEAVFGQSWLNPETGEVKKFNGSEWA